MSPTGAGMRPPGIRPMCPSEVSLRIGDSWLDRMAIDKMLGGPKVLTLEEIDEAVGFWVRGAAVAREADFHGTQLHGAYVCYSKSQLAVETMLSLISFALQGFGLSQFSYHRPNDGQTITAAHYRNVLTSSTGS